MASSLIAIGDSFRANTTITNLLGTISGGLPAIFYGNIPEDVDVMPVIAYYANQGDLKEGAVRDQFYTVNCFAETLKESLELADAILQEYDALWMTTPDFVGRVKCNIIASIPSPDAREFNTPIEFRVVNNNN